MQTINKYHVSVIIPTYGRAKYIEESVRSVLTQTFSNLEVLIIDDNGLGSTQQLATATIIDGLKDERVRYYPNTKNIGGSLSRNRGVSKSKGELVTFLDDDDLYEQTKVEKQVTALEILQADVCLCGMTVYVDDLERSITDHNSCLPKGENFKEFVLNGKALTPMIMLKKSIFNKVKGFDNVKKFQDHILMLKIMSTNPRVVLLNELLFVHRVHSGERISTNPSVLDAYYHRFNLENKLLSTLSKKDINQLKFNQNLLLVPVYFINRHYRKSIILFLGSLFRLRNIKNIQSAINILIPIKLKIFIISLV